MGVVRTWSSKIDLRNPAICDCGTSVGSNLATRYLRNDQSIGPVASSKVLTVSPAISRNCAMEATSSILGTTVIKRPVDASNAVIVVKPNCGGQSMITRS